MYSVNRIHLLILVVLWNIVHGFLFIHYGIRSFADTYAYIDNADFLLKYGHMMDTRHVFYSVPIILIAFFKLFTSEVMLPFIIFQCVVSAIAALALYKGATNIFKDPLAGLFSVLIFLFWFDVIHWNTVVMTESLLGSVICFLIAHLVQFRNTVMDYLLLLLLTILTLFIRPTGVVVVVGIVLFLLHYHWCWIYTRPVLKFGLLVGLFIVSLMGATLMFSLWDFAKQYEMGNVVTYADLIPEGSIHYHENLRIKSEHLRLAEPDTPPILKMVYYFYYNPIHAFKVGSLKVWYLVFFVRPYYSTLHNVFSLVWVAIIYLLFYVGLRKLPGFEAIRFFVVTVVFVNCALVFVSSVDWDNRFYIPMEPGIVLFTGGGISYLVRKKWNKLT